MRVLIVKTSSLGDVVHTLPALTDARAARPGIAFDWLVEAPFAEVPRWHPAVERVIPCALRRWRRQPLRAWRSGEWRAFLRELRGRPYDLVLDAQGLVKSAALALFARGPRAGPDRKSAREPLAALFYQARLPLPRRTQAHAVERLRRLFAAALDYDPPATPPDFGLPRERFPVPDAARPYVVFLHGTTWPTKQWPESSWQALGRWLAERGLDAVLPWGSDEEWAAAKRIAVGCGARVLPKLTLTALAGWLAHARAAAGVDTGLAHLAAAVGTPSVTLYGPTLPALTGTVGRDQAHLRSDDSGQINRRRLTLVPVARVEEALSAWLA